MTCKYNAREDKYELKAFIESTDQGSFTTVTRRADREKWLEIDDAGEYKDISEKVAIKDRRPVLAVYLRI